MEHCSIGITNYVMGYRNNILTTYNSHLFKNPLVLLHGWSTDSSVLPKLLVTKGMSTHAIHVL